MHDPQFNHPIEKKEFNRKKKKKHQTPEPKTTEHVAGSTFEVEPDYARLLVRDSALRRRSAISRRRRRPLFVAPAARFARRASSSATSRFFFSACAVQIAVATVDQSLAGSTCTGIPLPWRKMLSFPDVSLHQFRQWKRPLGWTYQTLFELLLMEVNPGTWPHWLSLVLQRGADEDGVDFGVQTDSERHILLRCDINLFHPLCGQSAILGLRSDLLFDPALDKKPFRRDRVNERLLGKSSKRVQVVCVRESGPRHQRS
jgi:hypothetical protein